MPRPRRKTQQSDTTTSAHAAPGSDAWLSLVAGAHGPQRDFMLSKSRAKMALAGRQSGKSWAVICSMINVASAKPHAQCLYLTFSGAAAERTTWPLAGEICRRYGVEAVMAKQVITLGNGSVIRMLGADDIAHMETFRGGKADLVVVDEVGAQPTRILQPLIDEICEPMLRATNGTLIVIGTPPRKKVGWFAEQWHGSGTWERFHWTGENNPYCQDPPFLEFVAEKAARRGVDVNHASIRREYFAEWVDDVSSSVIQAYSEKCNYEPARAPMSSVQGWLSSLLPGETAAVGVDPGSRDRMALQVVAWTPDGRVRQAGEWVTKRDARVTMSTLAAAIQETQRFYNWIPVYVDTSHRMAIDTLARDWGIGCVEGAAKTGRQAQLDRINDLAATGRLQVAKGSALDEDMRLTEWAETVADPAAVRHYAKTNHPDALDAFRYALSNSYLPWEHVAHNSRHTRANAALEPSQKWDTFR